MAHPEINLWANSESPLKQTRSGLQFNQLDFSDWPLATGNVIACGINQHVDFKLGDVPIPRAVICLFNNASISNAPKTFLWHCFIVAPIPLASSRIESYKIGMHSTIFRQEVEKTS